MPTTNIVEVFAGHIFGQAFQDVFGNSSSESNELADHGDNAKPWVLLMSTLVPGLTISIGFVVSQLVRTISHQHLLLSNWLALGDLHINIIDFWTGMCRGSLARPKEDRPAWKRK